MTTAPKPLTEKIRSTGKRKGPKASVKSEEATSRSISFLTASRPAPVTAETGTSGASARKVPVKYCRTSSVTSSSHSGSTRSILVRTISPRSTPSSRQISKCSRVWGMMPSSAAMTKATRSMPAAPATMLRTNFSWPGTSTIPSRCPQGRSRKAKPSSMVMPRAFSSFRRSVSMPVRARTREVLPWSTWPAVPSTISRIACLPGPEVAG